MAKLWGGRFVQETADEVNQYTTSIDIDTRLWKADIRGSLAHARMLQKTGIISHQEGASLIEGLEKIELDFEEMMTSGSQNPLSFLGDSEDIHSVIEQALYKKVGTVAGKLHTGRSRNDQVATALRIYLKEEVVKLQQDLLHFQERLIQLAESHLETLLPGLTHLQHGQPVSLAHHLMAYFWMFDRDQSRLKDALHRLNEMPLGAAALAGTSLPIDRTQTCEELKFLKPCENSLDAVSDRDFIVELCGAFSLIMTHLSRMAEEMILWSTPEFGFIELSDAVTTGSSLMPQKKNPDVAELVRGRTGRVYGALMGTLTVLKGLPLSYNRDLQEDKFYLNEALDMTRSSVRIMNRLWLDIKICTEKMKSKIHGDFSNATDLADYLVKKGMPFREAHEIVGRVVRYCLSTLQSLENIPLSELKTFSELFDEDVLLQLQPHQVLNSRTSFGGTAPIRVAEQIQRARERISKASDNIDISTRSPC